MSLKLEPMSLVSITTKSYHISQLLRTCLKNSKIDVIRTALGEKFTMGICAQVSSATSKVFYWSAACSPSPACASETLSPFLTLSSSLAVMMAVIIVTYHVMTVLITIQFMV